MNVVSISYEALNITELHCDELWVQLNQIIVWKSEEFDVSVKLHLIENGDLARLLINNRIHIKDWTVSSNVISIRESENGEFTFFDCSHKNVFFSDKKDITMFIIIYI